MVRNLRHDGWKSIGRGYSGRHKGWVDLLRIFREILFEAVDAFVKQKPEALKPLIREVALEAAAKGDREASRQTTLNGELVGILAQQLLKDRRLVHVAVKYALGGVQTWEFRV